MNETEDSLSGLSALDDESVLNYLLAQPDFFIRNARQVEQMRVPHQIKGATSLVEWQLMRQRQQIENLSEEITLLMEQAEANQKLFGHLLQLQWELVSSESLQQMLSRLSFWAQQIGLQGAYICLFSDAWHLEAPSEFTHLAISRHQFDPTRIQRFGQYHHYLGGLNGQETGLLLPQVKSVGSVAMSLLGEYGDLGVVIFCSRDRHHYQAGMGTLLINQVSKIVSELLPRWVQRL